MLTHQELSDFLEEKVDLYNRTSFIKADPIQIPHLFSRKEDIEIAGFLVATIAWGNRKSIIKNGTKLMRLMDNNPLEFVLNYQRKNKQVDAFVHRTFNGVDLDFFIRSLKNSYLYHGGLENLFSSTIHPKTVNLKDSIIHFRNLFLETNHQQRSEKHISNPSTNSATKRINMFLRWMVRKDNRKVDFGIWNNISPSLLLCPLDLHSGNVARKLGLLHRTQNDWKATEELTNCLKKFDSSDPVKYDFALFGSGVYGDI